MEFDIFRSWKNKIEKQYIICIITGIICGCITHFYMLTHKLPNWDEINNATGYGSGFFLGRWFLHIIHPIGGSASVPAIHGFLMIFCLAVASCLIIKLMGVKSITGSILIPALMVTFPSVACTMTFMFMAHTSAIAIVMICIAVLLVRKWKFGCIPACVLLICSMGIYQSYMSFAIALILMGMILDILRDKTILQVIKQGFIYVGVLIASVVIYIPICHYYYPAMATEGYGGISEMGKINIVEAPVMIARCYKRFLEYFIWKPYSFVSPMMQRMNITICILAVVLFIYLVVKKKLWKDKLRLVLLIILCGFMPLACAFVYFMAPEAPFSMLMLYAYVLIFVLTVGLLECCMEIWEKRQPKIRRERVFATGISAITACAVIISCYSSYLVTNRAYLRMEISYERVTSYFNRILTRVEETEGFTNGEPVAILGEFYYKTNPAPVELDAFNSEDLREMSGVALENGLITSGVRDNFIKTYIGFDMGTTTFDEKDEIMRTDEYEKMPTYPANGCIQKIHDVWVVKLCDTIPNK